MARVKEDAPQKEVSTTMYTGRDSGYPEKKVLSNIQIELLQKPLPKEAIKQHPSKPYLSTIKPMYVIERLNEVFGIGQWFYNTYVIEGSERVQVVVKGIFRVPEYGIEIENYGGNDNVDRGDAYKGAATDALTKIASYLEIGKDIFKGHDEVTGSRATAATLPTANRPASTTTRQPDNIAAFDPITETMKGGKHAGKLWIDLPSNYLEWAIKQEGTIKAKAEKTLAVLNSTTPATPDVKTDEQDEDFPF